MLRCDGVGQVRHRALGARNLFLLEPKEQKGDGVFYMHAMFVFGDLLPLFYVHLWFSIQKLAAMAGG